MTAETPPTSPPPNNRPGITLTQTLLAIIVVLIFVAIVIVIVDRPSTSPQNRTTAEVINPVSPVELTRLAGTLTVLDSTAQAERDQLQTQVAGLESEAIPQANQTIAAIEAKLTDIADARSDQITQVAEIFATLQATGVVVSTQINAMNATLEQNNQQDAALQATMDALVSANAISTATASAVVCYITPIIGYPTVNIRSAPFSDRNNVLDILRENERLEATGHNGGAIGLDRWWLVVITRGDGSTQDGWVSSIAVQTLDDAACGALTRIPGT